MSEFNLFENPEEFEGAGRSIRSDIVVGEVTDGWEFRSVLLGRLAHVVTRSGADLTHSLEGTISCEMKPNEVGEQALVQYISARLGRDLHYDQVLKASEIVKFGISAEGVWTVNLLFRSGQWERNFAEFCDELGFDEPEQVTRKDWETRTTRKAVHPGDHPLDGFVISSTRWPGLEASISQSVWALTDYCSRTKRLSPAPVHFGGYEQRMTKVNGVLTPVVGEITTINPTVVELGDLSVYPSPDEETTSEPTETAPEGPAPADPWE